MSIAPLKVKQNFSKAAATYDALAQFQQVEAKRVLDGAVMLFPETCHVLDVGCGTGIFAQLAAEKRTRWQVTGLDISSGMCREASKICNAIQSDAARLPLAERSVDMCVSSLSLQWVVDAPRAFHEMARVLKPGGRVILTTLGNDTLHELRHAADMATLPLGLLDMKSAPDNHAMAEAAGFHVLDMQRRVSPEFYPSVHALMDSMRRIGAGNNFESSGRGMMGAQKWRSMNAAYERLRTARGLPATWDKIFMVLQKRA